MTRSRPTILTLLPLLATLIIAPGCPGDAADDDDDRTIEPPAACNNPSLSNVSFSITIHFDGEDYPQNEIMTLMEEEWGVEVFSFNFFPAVITELGPDPDTLRPPKAVWTRWRGSDGQWWMRRAMATKIEGTLSIQFAFHRGGPASPVLLQDTHLIQPVPRDWWLAQFSEASWTVDFDQIPGGGPLLIATRR